MPYLGNNLFVAQPSYRNIDDISGSFDNTTTSFPLLVGGASPVPFPINSNQCLISVAGVVQRPDDSGTEGFRLSGGNIIFSAAPNTGDDFFGVILAGADYVNVGANFPSGSAAVPSITFDSDLDTGIYNSGANQVSITTAGTERLRITSAGNVGIGTTSPGGQLDVYEGTWKRLLVTYPDVYTTKLALSTGCYLQSSVADDAVKLYNTANGPTIFATNNTERARIDSSGRLLVGTSSARSNFFNSTFAPRLQIEGTDYSSSMASLICNSAGENAYLVLGRSKGTTIGSNTLLSADDLLGAITFQGSDGSEFCEGANIRVLVDGTPGANDMPSRLVFSTTPDGSATPVERLRIDSDGFLKAPVVYSATTASAANVNVDTSGYLQRSTSSIKYKTNVETIQDSYADKILNCRPVWYKSTAGKDNPEWGWWGFIAEEVAEIDPRLVHWKTTEPVILENGSIENVPCEPEPEGVQYERFVPHLLNLVKRQQQAIETLEAKVAALESA